MSHFKSCTWKTRFKATVHPKMKLSFTHPHVILKNVYEMNFFLLFNKKEVISATIDLQSIFFSIQWKWMESLFELWLCQDQWLFVIAVCVDTPSVFAVLQKKWLWINLCILETVIRINLQTLCIWPLNILNSRSMCRQHWPAEWRK